MLWSLYFYPTILEMSTARPDGAHGPGWAGQWLAAGRAGPVRRLAARTFENFRNNKQIV